MKIISTQEEGKAYLMGAHACRYRHARPHFLANNQAYWLSKSTIMLIGADITTPVGKNNEISKLSN